MSDYQAVYDAVRSRISGGNISEAVESVLRQENIGHYAEQAFRRIQEIAYEYERTSVLMRPKLSIDGDRWCALYGDNLQDGVAGFGKSPAEAMADFEVQWHKKLPTKE